MQEGQARAPAAGTVLNALANGRGSAFAIDEYVTARVALTGGPDPDADGDPDPGARVEGTVDGAPEADTSLVEACVARVTDRFGDGEGGRVRTTSEVPMAAGLKSSSAAANAAVMATLDALDATDDVSRAEAARLGVAAARDVGVTATGAFDDAAASMLGGVVVTDNRSDDLLAREKREWRVLVYTPPERAYSADADTRRCEQVAPVADLVAELALDGRFTAAMTVNGLAFCAALGFSADPAVAVMDDVAGVSLSGTGPSYVAVGTDEQIRSVRERWADREGTTLLTTTQTAGTREGTR